MFATNSTPVVLVIMPFDQKFDQLYRFGIQKVCQDLGVTCERVQKAIFQPDSLGKIHHQISKADLIIADVSEQTVDIFYELGYSSALGKEMLLLTSRTEHLSANFTDCLLMYYRDLRDLQPKLKQSLISSLGKLNR